MQYITLWLANGIARYSKKVCFDTHRMLELYVYTYLPMYYSKREHLPGTIKQQQILLKLNCCNTMSIDICIDLYAWYIHLYLCVLHDSNWVCYVCLHKPNHLISPISWKSNSSVRDEQLRGVMLGKLLTIDA